MPNHSSFRLNRSGMLLALISAAFVGEAAAGTGGRVDFATSGATVAGTDGQQRPLAKGTEIGTGDTIRTDAAARAQIRFTDGSYVSLQPNTEFAIKDYNFDGKTDGSESGIFGLAKGAMRAVTGLIGRVNRNKYQITTPTATVGIRGTGGRIEVLLDGSTLIAGTSGIWVLSNPSGTLDIPAGTFGRAPAAPNQPPQRSSQGPTTGPAPLPTDPPKPLEPKGVEAKTDSTCQTNPTSPACISSVTTTPPIKPLVSGSGYAASAAFGFGFSGLQSDGNATAIFNPSGQLTSVSYSDGQNFTLASDGMHGLKADGSLDFGTDGVLAWGRWIGRVTGQYNCDGLCNFNQSYDANQGFHYVIGTPTAVMPIGGGAVYTMIGATSPTDGTSLGSFSGVLNVTFRASSTSTSTINGDFKIAMPRQTYTWHGEGTTPNALFTLTTTSISCSGCSANVRGFFSGANAARAGIGYQFNDGSTISILGAAAFTKQP